MEVSFTIIHVGDIGDSPKTLTLNDVNKTDSINMYIDGKHYRVSIKNLEKAINAVK